MMRHPLVLASFAIACAGTAGAQSIGGMTSPSSGSSSAGGSPVGMVLPSSVQSGSTAPTQPGHTITGDRGTWRPGQPWYRPYASEDPAGTVARDARDDTPGGTADAPRTARAAP